MPSYQEIKKMTSILMSPATLEGQTLGKYRIMEPLGRGGMAQVYRAYHPQLDRYVAVKVLRSDLVENEEFLARFRREAQSVAGLRHPNIVQVYDFDVQDDLYYMVMELLEGDTLKASLNYYRTRGERMPWTQVLRILLDVLDGLGYAHGEGITHRDIKPANIMLTKRGQAVISDFGIAHIIGGTQYTVSGALIGTLNYMAPEQGLKGHGDSRSDIYSLGIVFYEMMLGHTPFDADTPLAILMKHLNDPLPLPHKLDPTIPEPFERVLLRALAKQPEERYQNASEMAQALIAAAQAAGVELPERLSLPQVPPAAFQPAGVGVYSGVARQQLVDQQFAADDTDAKLDEKLAAASGFTPPPGANSVKDSVQDAAQAFQVAMKTVAENVNQDSVKESWRVAAQAFQVAAQAVAHNVSQSVTQAVEGVSAAHADDSITKSKTEFVVNIQTAAGEQPGTTEQPGVTEQPVAGEQQFSTDYHFDKSATASVTASAVAGAGALIAVNAILLAAGLLTGSLGVFGWIWPIELMLLALLLSLLMSSLQLIWILIPAGFMLGNGILMAYCSLTGNWDHWSFLWIAELLIIAAPIFEAVRISRREDAQPTAKRMGSRLVRQSILGIMVTIVLGYLIYIVSV